MKDDSYTEIICKGYCKYYKKGKEELHCNGYAFLRDNLTSYELKAMLDPLKPQKDKRYEIPDKDERLISLICKKCDFYITGCDYTDNHSGPPCGGYHIITILLR